MPFDPIHVRPFVLAALLVPSLGCSAIVGYPCEQGYTSCGGQCVAVATDPENCGGCGHVCASHVCAGAVCMGEADAEVRDSSVLRDAWIASEAGMPDGGVPSMDDAATDDAGSAMDPDAAVVAMDDGGLDGGGASMDPDAAFDGGVSSDDGGLSSDDGGASSDDGGLSSDDGGDLDGSMADGGPPACDVGELSCSGVCVAVGSDPQNCGACGVSCVGDMACSDGTCVLACDRSEIRCGGGCFDPTSDPNHCGGCDIQCATGICVDSMCVTGYAGHLVMIGHDYTESRAAEDLVLWHAITVGAASTPRVVRYVGDDAATSSVDAALARVGVATSLVASSAEVPFRLATADVFLIDAQHDADEDTLVQIGTEWSRALDTFLGRGGVVIALDAIGTAGNGGASSWMAAAGLADPVDRRDVSSSIVRVVAAADGLAIGIPLSYRASTSSVQWIAPSLPVIVSADDTGGVVLHRTVLPM